MPQTFYFWSRERQRRDYEIVDSRKDALIGVCDLNGDGTIYRVRVQYPYSFAPSLYYARLKVHLTRSLGWQQPTAGNNAFMTTVSKEALPQALRQARKAAGPRSPRRIRKALRMAALTPPHQMPPVGCLHVQKSMCPAIVYSGHLAKVAVIAPGNSRYEKHWVDIDIIPVDEAASEKIGKSLYLDDTEGWMRYHRPETNLTEFGIRVHKSQAPEFVAEARRVAGRANIQPLWQELRQQFARWRS